MADANLFSQYLRPVKSVADFNADADKAESNRLGLENQRSTNALQALTMQQTQGTMADASAKRNAIQQVYAANPNADPLTRARALQANPLTAADGVAAEKAILENDKTRVGTAKDQGTVDEGNFKLRVQKSDQALKDVAAFETPQQAAASLQAHIAAGDVDPQRGAAMLQSIPQDAAQFATWQVRMLRGIMTATDQIKQADEAARSAATNATSITTTGMNNSTSRANNRDTIAAEDRRADGATAKAPAGYAWGPSGADGKPTMIAVKGGPADLKAVGALNQDTQALTGSIAGFDRLATAANELLAHPGLSGITGKMGVIPNAPGSQASNAEALLGTLKSQVGFGVLQDMRNNSKTGGALGAVSDAEGKRLESNLAALDKSQSIDQFQANLKKIIDYSAQAKDRVREAFNLRHGDQAVTQGADHPPEINDLLKKYGGK